MHDGCPSHNAYCAPEELASRRHLARSPRVVNHLPLAIIVVVVICLCIYALHGGGEARGANTLPGWGLDPYFQAYSTPSYTSPACEMINFIF